MPHRLHVARRFHQDYFFRRRLPQPACREKQLAPGICPDALQTRDRAEAAARNQGYARTIPFGSVSYSEEFERLDLAPTQRGTQV